MSPSCSIHRGPKRAGTPGPKGPGLLLPGAGSNRTRPPAARSWVQQDPASCCPEPGPKGLGLLLPGRWVQQDSAYCCLDAGSNRTRPTAAWTPGSTGAGLLLVG